MAATQELVCVTPRRRGGLLGLRPCRAVAARLRKEVRTCEYSDVYVMWEMLSVSEPTGGGGPGRGGRPSLVAAWSRLAFYCCAF